MRQRRIAISVLLPAVLFIGFGIVLGAAQEGAAPETVLIPAADGVELSMDLYRPPGEKAPTILIRTPYGAKQLAFVGEAFVARGYAVAIQDVRGRYESGGEHEPFSHERDDGLATLNWVAKQEWCDGRIGMWGISYSGYAALLLADAEVEAFKSIFSISGWIDPETIVRPGGAMHLQLDMAWMLTQQGRVQRNLGEFDVDALFRHTPLKDALRAGGVRHPMWEDPTWLDKLPRPEIGNVPRPVFHVTGWHDMVYRATLDAWHTLSAQSKSPHKLAIGPWYHNQMMFETYDVGDAEFGAASAFGTEEMIALSLRWFDATLRGTKNGILEEPPVSYFVMGPDVWHRDSSWPPAGSQVRRTRWYLDSGGAANSSGGDGKLTRSKPSGSEADRFVFDPMNPVPTLGGAIFFYFPEILGVRDQREIEQRDDVLVYTSSPMEEEIQITGHVRVQLHAASSGKDTDFTAKLVVVRPDGYARIVEDGIVRFSRQKQPAAQPGDPVAVQIDLGDTAISVPRGHRLRVEVSSSNFPKYDRNPNTGVDPFLAKDFETARQIVFHSTERASYIELPIRRRPVAVSAASREPLILPAVPAAEPIAAIEGDDASALLTEGRRLLEEDEVDKAIATLKRAVELQPEGPSEHLWLGRAYHAKLQAVSMFRKLGFSKKVRASFLRSVELDPDNVEARTSLANFYFQAPGIAGGSFDKGLEQADEIRKRDAKAAHLLMANAYRNNNDNEEAKQEYRAVIALDPGMARAHYVLGFLHQSDEEWSEAFAAFEDGVEKTDDMASLYQIGRTAALSGENLERGRQALEQYIEREPDTTRLPSIAAARWRLGMLYEHQGRKDLARQQYETALKLEPDMEQARESLENL